MKQVDLSQSRYDVLRNNPDLSDVIYLALAGSYGYGTNIETSDIDLRGVLIESKRHIYGLTPFEQFVDEELDIVIYGLRKFVRLCADANPNTLELLGVDDDSIVIATEKGKKLRDNVDLFLSKLVIHSFGNYATAQLRRLQNALCHDSYEELQKTIHLRNTLNSQLEHFRKRYTSFEQGAINIYVDEESGNLAFDIDLKNYPINHFVGIYSEISNTVKAYNKLNHRNNKKDEPHLYKHAMHLIRLLITGTDILNGKGIITKRDSERDFLMCVRNGEYSFNEIFAFVDKYQEAFDKAAAETKLPYAPNMQKIEDFLLSLY